MQCVISDEQTMLLLNSEQSTEALLLVTSLKQNCLFCAKFVFIRSLHVSGFFDVLVLSFWGFGFESRENP